MKDKDNDDDVDMRWFRASKPENNSIEIEYPNHAELDYELYKRNALRDDPSGQNILSFLEYLLINYNHGYDLTDTKVDKLEFLPPINPGAFIGGIVTAAGAVRSATSAVRSAREEFIEAVESVQSLKSEGDRFIEVIKGTGTQGSDSKGGDGGSYTDTKGGGHSSRLDITADPTEVRLNTGIVPNCYSQFYHDTSQTRANLHIVSNMLNFGSMDSNDKLSLFFDNVLSVLFQIAAQKNISFNVLSTTTFDKTALKDYLNTISKALQYYYFAVSVLNFTEAPNNKNSGMNALRNFISADNVDSLYTISRLLRGLPIPPNINEICFYLMQTYTQGSLPGAVLLKVIPHSWSGNPTTSPYIATGLNLSSDYSTVISELTSTNFRNITSMLARIAPDWITPNLLSPSPIALHDPQFLTIWSNIPSEETLSNGTAYFQPSVSSTSNTIQYCSHTNELDGFAFSLCSLYNVNTTKWSPSLWKQGLSSFYNTTLYSNKWTYTEITLGSPGFVPSNVAGHSFSWSRGHVYTSAGVIGGTQIPFGTEVVLNCSIDSVRETAYKSYEWLLNIEELAIQTNRTKGSDMVSSKFKRSVGKGKRYLPKNKRGK